MSNADLPGRQKSSQGVGMYVFALSITANWFYAETVLPGSFRKLPGFFIHETINRKKTQKKKEGQLL